MTSKMTAEEYNAERVDMLFRAIASLKTKPEDVIGTLLREFMRRRELIQQRRRALVDDAHTWARLSQQVIDLDAEIAKLRGAEKDIFDSIFQEHGGSGWLFDGRRGGGA